MILFHLVCIFVFCLVALGSVRRSEDRLRFRWSVNPFWIVLILYLSSAMSSLFVTEEMLPYFDFSRHSWSSFFLYTVSTLVLLSPILFFKGAKLPPVYIRKTRFVTLALTVLSFGVWFAFLYQLPYAVKSLGLGALEVRQSLNVDGKGILPETIMTTFSVVLSSFYVVFALLFYICVVSRFSVFHKVSMLLGSSLYVVSSLTFSARDGGVFWIMTMAFVYGLYAPSMSLSLKRKMRMLSFLLFVR